MRKILLILISLLFLSGCSLRQVYEPEINKMSVIEYDEEKMLLRRNLEVGNEDFTVEVLCENYVTKNPTITTYVYRNGELLGINDSENVFESDYKIKQAKQDDVLHLYEHLYYYDKTNPFNTFSYDVMTKISAHRLSEYRYSVKAIDTKDITWNLKESLSMLEISRKTGIYNIHSYYHLYTIITFPIFIILLVGILFLLFKYSITREKNIFLRMIDIINIIAFIGMLYFGEISEISILYPDYYLNIDTYKMDAICKTILWTGLLLRFCITYYIKYRFIKNPPKEYTGHLWIKDVMRKANWYEKKNY